MILLILLEAVAESQTLVSALQWVCTAIVFPLVGLVWWQQSKGDGAQWNRIDEHQKKMDAQDEAIAELRTELVRLDTKLTANLDALLKPKELQRMLDGLKQEIEGKLEKQRREVKDDLNTIQKLLIDAIRGGREA
jgi:hypothetical protein